MNKPFPLNMDYDRDHKIKALKGRGFTNHGSRLQVRQGAGPSSHNLHGDSFLSGVVVGS